MLSKKSVGIVGCGWLGQALAKYLRLNNYDIVGTGQSIERLNQISALGAIPERLILPLAIEDDTQYQCFNCQTLVIAITPQLRTGNTDYPTKIAQLVAKAKQGKVERIILINSTAIYGGLLGNITEDALLDFSQPKVELLQLAEKAVLESGLATVSLRVAGLVGPNRHPGNFFKQGRVIKDPNAYVNLIHQTDIVTCIASIISSPKTTGVYNVASNTKYTKHYFYQQAALSLGRVAPEFEDKPSHCSDKFIVSEKIRQTLGYQFEHDDLLSWIKADSK